jgi:acyl-coenzyme A thioesterase PaaI-like protein
MSTLKKRPITNPFTSIDQYNCFGCAPSNEFGLQMEFYDEGEETVCEWEPRPHFQGYGNILHGGIISTLMDEIASWYVFTKLKTAGVTYKLEVQFKSPVYTDRGSIILRAKLKDLSKRKADIDVKLYDHTGELCSEGVVGYFVFPEKWAREKLYYPDFDSFFQE